MNMQLAKTTIGTVGRVYTEARVKMRQIYVNIILVLFLKVRLN